VLVVALVVVLGVAAAGVATDVVSDVAAERRGSGLERGGWRLGYGAVVRSGSVCRLSRGAGGIFEGGEEVVVVVVNDVGVVDGGCASPISGDVAALAVLVTRAVGAGESSSVWVAASVVFVVVCILKLT
jgi:hypothetical protein